MMYSYNIYVIVWIYIVRKYFCDKLKKKKVNLGNLHHVRLSHIITQNQMISWYRPVGKVLHLHGSKIID